MSLDPITAVSDLVKTTLDKIFPDANQKAQAQAAFQTLQATEEFQLLAGQLQINLAEASSTNWWVAAWRPASGWCCVFALFIQFVVTPIGHAIGINISTLDTGPLITMLLSLLGIAGLRTYEKRTDSEANR